MSCTGGWGEPIMSKKKLPITDSGWFLMESRATPMHVGGLQLFDPPEGVKDPIGGFFREMREHSDVREMLRKKLFAPFGPAINPMWTEDRDFDIEYHVRHSALPKPGPETTRIRVTSSASPNTRW